MSEPHTYVDVDVELVTAATEQHHIDFRRTDAMGNNPCVCDEWWDSVQDRGWDEHMAEVAVAALAAEGRLLPGEVDPDLWQYGWRDPDEGDEVVAFEGRPGIITRRMVRRPLRVVGPWLPAPTTPRFGEREDDRG